MLMVLQPRMPSFRTSSLYAECVCYLLSANGDLFEQTMEEGNVGDVL